MTIMDESKFWLLPSQPKVIRDPPARPYSRTHGPRSPYRHWYHTHPPGFSVVPENRPPGLLPLLVQFLPVNFLNFFCLLFCFVFCGSFFRVSVSCCCLFLFLFGPNGQEGAAGKGGQPTTDVVFHFGGRSAAETPGGYTWH